MRRGRNPTNRLKRKRWSCGHRGWGQYCHRCDQATMMDARAELAALPKNNIQRLCVCGKTYELHLEPSQRRPDTAAFQTVKCKQFTDGTKTPADYKKEAERLRSVPARATNA